MDIRKRKNFSLSCNVVLQRVTLWTLFGAWRSCVYFEDPQAVLWYQCRFKTSCCEGLYGHIPRDSRPWTSTEGLNLLKQEVRKASRGDGERLWTASHPTQTNSQREQRGLIGWVWRRGDVWILGEPVIFPTMTLFTSLRCVITNTTNTVSL